MGAALADSVFVVIFGIGLLMFVLFTIQACAEFLGRIVQWLIDYERA